MTASSIKVADECWVALASLSRENPGRPSFTTREILQRVRAEHAHEQLRPGISAHLHQHNVANAAPSTARYRMFFRTSDGGLRLYRPGDAAHLDRHGKTSPSRADLPPGYHSLVDWYESEYCQGVPESEDDDPILRLRGLGREIWADTDVDAWVSSLRSGWDGGAVSSASEQPPRPSHEPQTDDVWQRILRYQGEEFRTATKLPYTYSVEGESGIWFYRDGRRIEHRLWRGELEAALKRPAISRPSDLKQFQCPAYLFGLLTDPRITGGERGA